MDDRTRRPPSGLVTFVFTDIEGSTRLLRRAGERYVALLERHRELLRSAWRAHGGCEVDSEGDAFLVAFASASDAVAACAAGQRLLAAEPWPDGEQVRVRMGVHTGLAAPRAGRYVAVAVHQGARVAAVGHGGQVVVSADAAAQLEPRAAAALVPLGRFRLRDFDEPVALFQLPGGRRDLPAVRALPAERHNLVPPLTGLVGRESDVTGVRAALASSRLVTVVGTGGVGKTRLATEVGIAMAPDWPDGVWFVDLAPVDDPARVPGTVAAALGLPGTDTADPWQNVLDGVAGWQALVLLDNCERHVRDIAARTASLLRACPRLRILATSREPLHLSGEAVWRLQPLPTPPAGSGDGFTLRDSAAVRLFVERARAVRAGFDPDAAELVAVADICRRLDGLPLALEIAAARMSVLQPEEIRSGLDSRFALLRSSDVTQPERQRTLDALLDWSMRLLAPAERASLLRLSVFGSSFRLDAATAALRDDVDELEVPELVWSLVEKSLVVADPAAGSTRYRLLETVRAYTRRLLDAEGSTRAVAGRLTAWYLERLGPRQAGARGWVGAVGTELGNLRALVPLVADVDEEAAQQVACVLARHHEAVQTFRDGIDEVGRLASELRAATPARVALLTALSDLHLRVGDAVAAARTAREAEALRPDVGTPDWDEVGVEKSLGEIAIRQRRPELAARIAEEALASGLSLRGAARMCNLLGLARISAGDAERAGQAFQAELDASQLLGDDVLLAHAHGNVAELALRTGDLRAAAQHQLASLGFAVALGQTGMVAYTLNVAGRLAGAEAPRDPDWHTSVRLTAKAEALLDHTGLALYDEDRLVTDATLDAARTTLGTAAFDEEAAAGVALDVAEAVTLAEAVLSKAAEPVPAHQ